MAGQSRVTHESVLWQEGVKHGARTQRSGCRHTEREHNAQVAVTHGARTQRTGCRHIRNENTTHTLPSHTETNSSDGHAVDVLSLSSLVFFYINNIITIIIIIMS